MAEPLPPPPNQPPPTQPYQTSPPPPPPPSGSPPTAPPPSASTLDPARLDRALVALGVALLSATVVMASFYSRLEDDLDGSNFVMGVAASLGLLGIAAAAQVLVADPVRKSELVAWPGAFGAVGAGLMVGVLMDDHALTGYVAGLLIVALSVGGYLLVRRGSFVVSTVVGLLIVYLSIFDDVFDAGDLDGDNFAIIIGVAILIFTAAVTVGGWFLPETRVLSAVVAGVIAVVSNAGLLTGLAVVATFTRALGGFDADSGSEATGLDEYNNDAWLVLVFSLLLVAGWAYLTYATGHVGFPLLMAAMCATVIPLVTAVLTVEHPTWWEVVVGLVGGGVLLLAGVRALGVKRSG